MAITAETIQSLDYEPRRWTMAEYYRLGEYGFFEGQHVELIEGEIICMSPIGVKHSKAVELATKVFWKVFGDEYRIRSQMPISANNQTESEPDIAIIKGDVRESEDAHPNTAALIVEVADSSLNYDRTVKSSLYARSAIKEYWILNLNDRCLEVYREPAPMPNQRFGFGYLSLRIYQQDQVSPLEKPDAKIKVADLLP